MKEGLSLSMARAMNQVPNKEQKLPRLNTSAFRELCRVSFLDDAWRQVNKSNKKSSGVDGVTIGQFANNLEPNLRLLAPDTLRRFNRRDRKDRRDLFLSANSAFSAVPVVV